MKQFFVLFFFPRMVQCQQDVDAVSVYPAQFAEAACTRSLSLHPSSSVSAD